jgi:hypothetical protein
MAARKYFTKSNCLSQVRSPAFKHAHAIIGCIMFSLFYYLVTIMENILKHVRAPRNCTMQFFLENICAKS